MWRLSELRASGLARGAAVLAVLALVAGPLLTSWHEATTVHAVCAVHPSELVHVQSSPAASASEEPAVAGAPRARADDEHERCAFEATRAPMLAGQAPVSAGAPSTESASRGVPAEAVRSGWPLYRLAPKSSPPA